MATLQDILKKAAGASGGLSPLGPLTTPIVTALTSKKQAQPTATRKTYKPSSTTRQVVSQNNQKANNTILNAPTAVSNTVTPPQSTVTSVTPPAANTTARETVTVYKNGQSRDIDKNLVKSFEDAGFSLRPITPAPTMLRGEDTTTPMSDDDIQKSLLKKSFKQQYGDSLTDQELDFLARQQMTTAKTQEDQIAALQSAQEAQLAKLAEIRTGEEARLAARTAEEEAKNKALLQDYRASEEARAAEQRALAERFGTEQQAVSERLLGTRGNLTSTVGTQEIERIQRDTMNTISSINAAKNAAIALKEAELAGASEAKLDVLRGQLNDLRSSEQEAILQAETDLQNAKLEALQAGDTARQTMIQSALDGLSIEKASKADAALTKNINDGYIYDEFGQRIADAEGNLLTYDTPEEVDKLIEVSPGASLFDPVTGQSIFSAPTAKMLQGEIGTGATQSPYQAERALRTIQSVDELKSLAQKSPGIFGRTAALPIPESARSDDFRNFSAQLNTLKSSIIQNELTAMREASKTGGALGSVSDKESEFLSSALGALDMRQSPENFIQQLDKIKNSVDRWQQTVRQEGGVIPIGDQSIEQNTDYQLLIQQGVDPQEAREYLGLTNVGSDTNPAAKVAAAIGHFESGGNYKARGPVVTSGQYKGERAMGKYQIMPGNLSSWSREALGRVVSEEEFMNNPQIQDAIAQYKMGNILKQYGTVEDVASVWFSGRPLARAGNAKDVLGTSVPQYVKNVRSIYNSLG